MLKYRATIDSSWLAGLGGLRNGRRGFHDHEQDVNGADGVGLDGIFGIAYTLMHTEIRSSTASGVDGNDSSFDPVLSLRAR